MLIHVKETLKTKDGEKTIPPGTYCLTPVLLESEQDGSEKEFFIFDDFDFIVDRIDLKVLSSFEKIEIEKLTL
jgi:hypothetical protein